MSFLREDLENRVRPIMITSAASLEELKPLSPMLSVTSKKQERSNKINSPEEQKPNASIDSPTLAAESMMKRLVSERQKSRDLEDVVESQRIEIQMLKDQLSSLKEARKNDRLNFSPGRQFSREDFVCQSGLGKKNEKIDLNLRGSGIPRDLLNPHSTSNEEWEEEETLPFEMESEDNKGVEERKNIQGGLRDSSLLWRNSQQASAKQTIIVRGSQEVLEKLVIELEAEMAEKNNRVQELDNQIKKTSILYWKTMNEKLKQDIDLEAQRKRQQALQQEIEYKDSLLEEKEREMKTMVADVTSKSESNYKMAMKLLNLQTKISNVEIQLRRFPVKKVYRLYSNADVELTLLKNPSNGTLSIDVFESGRHTNRPLKSIQGIPGSENRFLIYYMDGACDTFESDMSTDIVRAIREIERQRKQKQTPAMNQLPHLDDSIYHHSPAVALFSDMPQTPLNTTEYLITQSEAHACQMYRQVSLSHIITEPFGSMIGVL
ncbi:erythrocyte binding protein [Planoprotostelium fungivorum]|uniref:Erythrocyte binding protein n=1 Tax=Planoprotostelium fungivorum TaxID=1890364 RepID=A0A2P6NFR3_9EUKA|nr:erythrocyte binding protein [Planoprotostelium fungivorum]